MNELHSDCCVSSVEITCCPQGRRQGEVTEPGLSPFRPRLNSSPLPGRRLVMQLGRRGCSLEDTFEGDGEEQSLYSSHSVVNKSHRRKSTQVRC